MKVFAVNSSARVGGQSKTELILNQLVKGMKEEGAEVEVANIFKKKIHYCIGCFTCWTKTPGQCVHHDDMSKELFPKYMASDLCIMATPLFHYTLNANLKTFIERTLPFAQPFFERNTADPLVTSVLDALTQGGRELVRNKTISAGTMKAIHTPITDFKTLAVLGNIFWQTCIDEGVTPKEFDTLGLMPRPNSLESFLALMKAGFNPKKAQGFKGSYQFIFSGKQEGACYFTIDQNKIHCSPGSSVKPDITITTPFDVWMDIVTRKAEGSQMFMEQKYKVEGDINLLIKMSEVFG